VDGGGVGRDACGSFDGHGVALSPAVARRRAYQPLGPRAHRRSPRLGVARPSAWGSFSDVAVVTNSDVEAAATGAIMTVMDDRGTPSKITSARVHLARWLGVISPWALLAGTVAGAVVYGLELWVLIVGGFSLVYTAVHRVLSKRIEERPERKPELRLVIADHGEFVETMTSTVPPTWPFDADRIIAHEVKRVHDEAEASESLARRPGIAMLHTDPFAIKPRAEEYDRTREKFASKVAEHKRELHTWLDSYGQAAHARARTFELPLWIISDKSGAYAEDVVLAIDLPPGVEVVEEWPTIPRPPEPPHYVPPQPRSAFDVARPPSTRFDMASLASRLIPTVPPPHVSPWRLRSDCRRIDMSLGSIHHDTTVELAERLLLRVAVPGRHVLRWTLRTKNRRRHCTGKLELIVRGAAERSPFTRLEGIQRYPDVPFVDEDGEVLVAARTSDPPTEPPPSPDADDTLERLSQIGAYNDWLALGLGDDDDEQPRANDAA